VHPGDLAGGFSDLEMTWLLYCAGTATAGLVYEGRFCRFSGTILLCFSVILEQKWLNTKCVYLLWPSTISIT